MVKSFPQNQDNHARQAVSRDRVVPAFAASGPVLAASWLTAMEALSATGGGGSPPGPERREGAALFIRYWLTCSTAERLAQLVHA